MRHFSIRSLFFLIVVFGISLPTHNLRGQNIERQIDKAVELTEAGKYKEAIKIYDQLLNFDQIIEDDDMIPMVYLLKGMAVVGDRTCLSTVPDIYKEALFCFNKSIQMDSLFAPAYTTRAALKSKNHDFQGAIDDLTAAIGLADSKKDIFHYWMEIATLQAYLQNYPEALEACDMANNVIKGSWEVDHCRGFILLRQEKYEEAIPHYKAAIKKEPDEHMLFNNYGLILVRMGKYKKGLKEIEKALELDSEDPYAYSNRGFAKLMLGDTEGALKDLNRSIIMNPENAYAFKNRALIYLELKETEKACADLRIAEELGYEALYGGEVKTLLKVHCR